MKQLLLLALLVTASLSLNAQTKKSKVTITREINAAGKSEDNLTIKFVGPSKQPVKSHVKMDVNGEIIFPEMDEKGVYTDHLEPGTYKLNFSVPYWYDATIEKLKCGKNENITITVTFSAKDI
ncbi:MAG: hypothetical protein H0U95_10965 [Bacteroidetes bacterium]|nr:hypothetical protein [Bacteroidota bacterium]